MMARLLPDTDPLQKVTIIPRGQALGATEQVPTIERHNIRRGYLLNRIAVTLGGRAAELVAFNELSSGAAADLKGVTRMARLMVCQWGMSERIGPVYIPQGEEHPFLGREIASVKTYSEETSRQIDEEIHRIVAEQEQRAVETLRSRRHDLDALAAALLEHETLDAAAVDRILEGSGTKANEPEPATEPTSVAQS
jgi:cell division protease FtsH